MHVGKPCFVCGLNDFLPFTCDACSEVFCLDHRSYQSHNCKLGLSPSNPKNNQVQVITCPKCKRGIRVDVGESFFEIVQRHLNDKAACKPIEKCPAPGCKEKLTLTNRLKCDKCGIETCLKHRFVEDHACKGIGRTSVGVRMSWTVGNEKKGLKKRGFWALFGGCIGKRRNSVT